MTHFWAEPFDSGYTSTGCLIRVTGEAPTLEFSDAASDAYYAEPVMWAAFNRITAGTGNGMFSPDQTCTRGQIVTFIFRYANLHSV